MKVDELERVCVRRNEEDPSKLWIDFYWNDGLPREVDPVILNWLLMNLNYGFTSNFDSPDVQRAMESKVWDMLREAQSIARFSVE